MLALEVFFGVMALLALGLFLVYALFEPLFHRLAGSFRRLWRREQIRHQVVQQRERDREEIERSRDEALRELYGQSTPDDHIELQNRKGS